MMYKHLLKAVESEMLPREFTQQEFVAWVNKTKPTYRSKGKDVSYKKTSIDVALHNMSVNSAGTTKNIIRLGYKDGKYFFLPKDQWRRKC